jgi:hypothetical protein
VDQDMVIPTGLQQGETVVTEGQLRPGPNSRVMIRDGRGNSVGGQGKGGGRRGQKGGV